MLNDFREVPTSRTDAFANAATSTYGIIVYGVDPRRPDPIVGMTSSYDDAKLQQLTKGKIAPLPEFLYYELQHGARTLALDADSSNAARVQSASACIATYDSV